MASLFLPAPVRNKTRQTTSNNNNTASATGSSTALTTTAKRPQAGAGASANKAPKVKAPSYEQRVRATAEFSKLTPAQRKNCKPL